MKNFPLFKTLLFGFALLPLSGQGEDMPTVPADLKVGTYLEDYDCTIISKLELSTPSIPEGMPHCRPGRHLVPIDGKGRVEYINMTENKRMSDRQRVDTITEISSQKTRGYIETQGKHDQFTGLRHPKKNRRFVPLSDIPKPQAVEWKNIDLNKIEGVEFKGARWSLRKNNDIYGVYRKFNSELLGDFYLEEYDYHNGGIIIQVPVETINYAVNGYPAIYRVHRDRSGKASSTQLRWFTDKKMFVLIVLDSLYDKPYNSELFFRIAKAVD